MSRQQCPHCDNMLVNGTGPRTSKILLLSNYPDFEDQKSGVALSGNTHDMMVQELANIGIQLSSVRFAYIWQHTRNEKCNFQWHVDIAMKEIEGKTHVLLMGSDATRALFDRNAGDIGGLVMTSKLFPKVQFVASPSPAEMFNSSVGEMRFSLSTFGKLIKK